MRSKPNQVRARWRKVLVALVAVGGVVLFSAPLDGQAASKPVSARGVTTWVAPPEATTAPSSTAPGTANAAAPSTSSTGPTTNPSGKLLPFPGGKLPTGVQRARDAFSSNGVASKSGAAQGSPLGPALSPESIEAAMKSDTAFVDSNGLFYVDEQPVQATTSELAAVTPARTHSQSDHASPAYPATQNSDPLLPGDSQAASPITDSPLTDTFRLHSRPGSTKSIYLHFGGTTLTNTAWNNRTPTVPSITFTPYDFDGSPSTFGDSERAVIQKLFRSVAEDFAPFDVDVTTEAPSYDRILRSSLADQEYGTWVVISPTIFACTSCSGVAYLNAFGSYGSNYLKPALVFPSSWWFSEPEVIASVVSHEVGHNFGLSHDTELAHDGFVFQEYYRGYDSWIPIMGGGVSRPYSHWSRGEYPHAGNREDDIAIIASNAPVVTDDHGSTTGGATVMSAPGYQVFDGRISSSADVDMFRVQVTSTLEAILDVMDVGRNLRPKMTLLNSAGEIVASAWEYSEGGAFLQKLWRPPGTYYIKIEGASGPNWGIGIPAYGNLGRYSLSIETVPLAETPNAITGSPRFGGFEIAWWGALNDTVEVEVCSSGGTCSTQSVVGSNGQTGFTGLIQGGTYTYRLRGSNARGVTEWSTPASIVVQGYGAPLTEMTASASAHVFSRGGAVYLGGYPNWPTGAEVRVRDRTTNGAWTSSLVESSSFSITTPISGHVYQFQVRHVDGANLGLWSDVREAIVGREAAAATASSSTLVPTTRPSARTSNTVTTIGRTAAPWATGVRATA